MSTRIYHDEDADLGVLDDRVVAVLGYGNQGREQAQNLRHSGVGVVVGNRSDSYRDRAVRDGFAVADVPAVTRAGQAMLMYLSGEPAEVFARIAATGLLEPLRTRSRTRQEGQLTKLAGAGELVATLRSRFADVLHGDILSGRFAADWSTPGKDTETPVRRLRHAMRTHPLARAERAVRERRLQPAPGAEEQCG